VSDELAEAVHRETDGNPFFIEEVIKELIERERIYRIGDHWEREEMAELAIPQSIKEAIGRRLDRLSSTCVSILQTAAGIGKNFDYEVLASVVAIDEDDLLDALDEADTVQLIRPATGEAYIFTHDKIREVLYTELNPIRRRKLHRRIGNALEQLFSSDLGSRAQELAYHFIESGELNKGLRYSLEAAKRAEGLFAQDEALKFYSDARDCAETLNDPDSVLEINVAMADLYALGGQNRLAIKFYERAIASTKSKKAHAALLAKLGAVHATTGDERGLALLHKAIAELDQDESRLELATATIALGRFHHLHAEYTAAIEHYERARTLAEHLDDPSILSSVYAYLAGSYQHLTDYDTSLNWARKTIALGERRNYPFAIAAGNEFFAENYASMGRWTEALEAADRDSHFGKQSGSQSRVAWADFSRGMALRGLGNLDSAAAAFRASVDLAKQIGEMRLARLALVYLGGVLTDLGDHEEARVVGKQVITDVDESSEKQAQAEGYGFLGYLYLQQGAWTIAVANYKKAMDIVAGTENKSIMLLHFAGYAESLLGIGRTEEALIHARTNLALAEKAQSIYRIGVTYKVLGQILAAQEKHEDAAQFFDRSIDILEDTKTQLWLGRAYLQRGVMRKAIAILPDARRDISRAASIFKELGAAYDLRRANDLLSAVRVP
jgi:tetratricopeptide (TPR) repeat protein